MRLIGAVIPVVVAGGVSIDSSGPYGFRRLSTVPVVSLAWEDVLAALPTGRAISRTCRASG